jgi:hypothetical protein
LSIALGGVAKLDRSPSTALRAGYEPPEERTYVEDAVAGVQPRPLSGRYAAEAQLSFERLAAGLGVAPTD